MADPCFMSWTALALTTSGPVRHNMYVRGWSASREYDVSEAEVRYWAIPCPTSSLMTNSPWHRRLPLEQSCRRAYMALRFHPAGRCHVPPIKFTDCARMIPLSYEPCACQCAGGFCGYWLMYHILHSTPPSARMHRGSGVPSRSHSPRSSNPYHRRRVSRWSLNPKAFESLDINYPG